MPLNSFQLPHYFSWTLHPEYQFSLRHRLSCILQIELYSSPFTLIDHDLYLNLFSFVLYYSHPHLQTPFLNGLLSSHLQKSCTWRWCFMLLSLPSVTSCTLRFCVSLLVTETVLSQPLYTHLVEISSLTLSKCCTMPWEGLFLYSIILQPTVC
jgi:hypothetical protein